MHLTETLVNHKSSECTGELTDIISCPHSFTANIHQYEPVRFTTDTQTYLKAETSPHLQDPTFTRALLDLSVKQREKSRCTLPVFRRDEFQCHLQQRSSPLRSSVRLRLSSPFVCSGLTDALRVPTATLSAAQVARSLACNQVTALLPHTVKQEVLKSFGVCVCVSSPCVHSL